LDFGMDSVMLFRVKRLLLYMHRLEVEVVMIILVMSLVCVMSLIGVLITSAVIVLASTAPLLVIEVTLLMRVVGIAMHGVAVVTLSIVLANELVNGRNHNSLVVDDSLVVDWDLVVVDSLVVDWEFVVAVISMGNLISGVLWGNVVRLMMGRHDDMLTLVVA